MQYQKKDNRKKGSRAHKILVKNMGEVGGGRTCARHLCGVGIEIFALAGLLTGFLFFFVFDKLLCCRGGGSGVIVFFA